MKISVVIPVYNAAPYVEAALRSVWTAVAHTDADVEAVCVDDGSTDASGTLLDALAAAEPRLRVLHQPNGGEGAARNAGLALAAGDWVAFLDADDLWLPNLLTCAAEEIAATPDADAIAFRFLPFDDGAPTPAPEPPCRPRRVFDLRDAVAGAAICEMGVFPTLFRRSRLTGLSFSSLPLGADRLYVAQFLAAAKKVVLADAAVEAYRVREGSMARADWNLRKMRSLLDYADGAWDALSRSGRRVGRAGADYLASVLLSVAPTQLARMADAAEREAAGRLWLATLAARPLPFASAKFRILRRVFLGAGLRPSLRLAHAFRALKVM